MTISEAISGADTLRPANPYTDAQKLAWLSALDGGLLLGAIGGSADELKTYTSVNETLMIPPPFDRAYPVYLAAQIDFADMEWEAYAASSRMYNSIVDEFTHDWLRRHRPAKNRIKY